MFNDTELAYLAGMIDADGFISISRALKMNRGRCKPSIYHSLKVGICGTNRAPHDLARRLFGGNVTCYKPKNKDHQTNYQWNASGPTAVFTLKKILPYLIVKYEQALVAFAFQDLINRQREDRRYEQIVPFRITDEMRME